MLVKREGADSAIIHILQAALLLGHTSQAILSLYSNVCECAFLSQAMINL